MIQCMSGQFSRQVTFLPSCVDGLIAQESPVRFIAAFVDSLNLREMGFT